MPPAVPPSRRCGSDLPGAARAPAAAQCVRADRGRANPTWRRAPACDPRRRESATTRAWAIRG